MFTKNAGDRNGSCHNFSIIIIFAFLFISLEFYSLYGETNQTATNNNDKGFQNAIQFEAGAGILMAQYVFYYERLIIPQLSINLGAGYCPLANNGIHDYSLYSYGVYVLELKGYPMSESLKDLYIAGCVGMYFADTLLDWSYYDMVSTNKGSVAIATQISAGWKFVIPINNIGIVIDPEVYFYTAVPTSISTVSTTTTETFAFRPYMVFINIYVGIEF